LRPNDIPIAQLNTLIDRHIRVVRTDSTVVDVLLVGTSRLIRQVPEKVDDFV